MCSFYFTPCRKPESGSNDWAEWDDFGQGNGTAQPGAVPETMETVWVLTLISLWTPHSRRACGIDGGSVLRAGCGNGEDRWPSESSDVLISAMHAAQCWLPGVHVGGAGVLGEGTKASERWA